METRKGLLQAIMCYNNSHESGLAKYDTGSAVQANLLSPIHANKPCIW